MLLLSIGVDGDKIPLDDKDVISLKEGVRPLGGCQTFKAIQLTSSLGNSCSLPAEWATEGVPCEILRQNKPWQKGKIRISLEFVPDESEEVNLDEILNS